MLRINGITNRQQMPKLTTACHNLRNHDSVFSIFQWQSCILSHRHTVPNPFVLLPSEPKGQVRHLQQEEHFWQMRKISSSRFRLLLAYFQGIPTGPRDQSGHQQDSPVPPLASITSLFFNSSSALLCFAIKMHISWSF